VIRAYKKLGQTPLELIDELRRQNPDLKNQKLSYAGRLDPMAEGQMIIMVGDLENKNRQKFLNADKLYEADILVGFSTDSYDALGVVETNIFNNSVHEQVVKLDNNSNREIFYKDLKKALRKIKQIDEIKYPHFSSKTASGKPLWQWKKEGLINQIEIPSRQIKIKKIKVLENQSILGTDLINYLKTTISKINGDFRQEEIIKSWENEVDKSKKYQVIKIKCKVSSGTYIRSLVNELSNELGVPCCLLKLNRKKVYSGIIYKLFR